MSSGKRVVDCSEDFMVEDAALQKKPVEKETDPHRIAQRQKQIDLGKNTLGYQLYRDKVPREKRKRRVHPTTPDVYQACSKRQFDGQVKKWRRMLHEYDPQEENAQSGPSSNPLAPETSYEMVSHEDCQSASPAAKSRGSQRLGGGGQPPRLQTLTALRKRNYSESSMTSLPFSPSTAALVQPGASKQAKVHVSSSSSRAPLMAMQPSPAARAAQPSPAAAVAMAPTAEGVEEEEEIDYGEDEDWAYIEAAEKAGTSIYTNWGALEADSSLEDIML